MPFLNDKSIVKKNQGNNQTFLLLADITSLGTAEDIHGWLSKNFTSCTGCCDFLIFSTTDGTCYLKNYQDCRKGLKILHTYSYHAIFYTALLAAVIQFCFCRWGLIIHFKVTWLHRWSFLLSRSSTITSVSLLISLNNDYQNYIA